MPFDKEAMARNLALAIRARRKQLGWTQEKLGREARCGIAYIYLVENGKPTLRLDKLLDVLTALKLQFRLENGVEGVCFGEDEERVANAGATAATATRPLLAQARPTVTTPTAFQPRRPRARAAFDFID